MWNHFTFTAFNDLFFKYANNLLDLSRTKSIRTGIRLN